MSYFEERKDINYIYVSKKNREKRLYLIDKKVDIIIL